MMILAVALAVFFGIETYKELKNFIGGTWNTSKPSVQHAAPVAPADS